MQYETLKLKLVSLVNNFCGSISLEVRDSSGEPILAYNERDVPDSQHDQSMCKIVSVNINKRSKASIRLAPYSIIQLELPPRWPLLFKFFKPLFHRKFIFDDIFSNFDFFLYCGSYI